jgi:hypothetical protein
MQDHMEPSTTLLISLIAASIGFLVGLLITSLVGNKNDQIKSQPDLPTSTDQPGLSSSKSHPTILSIWREPPMGALRIDMGGHTYKSVVEVADGERQKLRVTIADLEAWLSGGAPVLIQGSTSKITTGPGKPTPDIGNEDLADRPSLLAPLSTSLMTAASRAAAIASLTSPTQSKSIAAQIDDILQGQIAGSPLEMHGVHLKEIPDHGVVVIVDTHQYQGIDDVPDTEVRSAIKHAVQTWENKTE